MPDTHEPPIEQADSDESNFQEKAGDELETLIENTDVAPVLPDELTDKGKAVEDFTLAELLGSFFKKPRETVKAFVDVVQQQDTDAPSRILHIDNQDLSQTDRWLEQYNNQPGGLASAILSGIANVFIGSRIAGYSIAFIFVLAGNIIMAGDVNLRRSEEMQLAQGFPLLVFGFLLWLLTEFAFALPELKSWWQNRGQPSDETIVQDNPTPESQLPLYIRIPLWRWILALVATILSTITWLGTANNTFSMLTFYIWLLSIASWSFVFAPLEFNIFDQVTAFIDRLRAFRWQKYIGVMLALAIIIGVAGYFRFYRLADHPLEMTDDHVEKILDSGRVRDGARNIFFANNGGREPLQMYLIAMISHLPGFGINHDTIKFVSSLESLLTIPALFWMGYAIFESESKQRRLLIALILAALAATSYWHVAITRQGLRIPLTPLVVSLHLIYLLRGIRHNRRSDFIIAGLILGFGLYTYQAVRMLPVVIVITVVIAFIFTAKSLQERLRYVVNLAVLVAISFSVFLPMFRYSVDYPEQFWRRTAGRLLGDDVITETLADGTIVERNASIQERVEAFMGNMPTIASNIRNVLLMFNWEGDVATISGVSNRPAMDVYSGTLLILGLAAWIAFALRRGDTVYWLIPLIAFLMLLPSALSIAFPHENPSHTRTSGAIPTIYLLAAFPLALFIEQILDLMKGRGGKIIAGLVSVVVIAGSFNANSYLYFEVYPERYEESFHPYSDAGRYLYGYILQGGAYGNAYLIGYEHWWSHRAIGLEGGLEEFWTGGVYPYVDGEYSTQAIIQAIYANLGATGTFKFNPDADLLFFYSPNDDNTANALEELFPDGTASERPTYNPNETFMVYEVPASGEEGLQDWVLENPPE